MTDVSFYKDPGKRILRPELFSKTAADLATRISSSDKKKNKRTQLRKFYDEVLRLNGLAKGSPDRWEQIHPYVNMLIAKATYAEGRELVTEEFVDFITKAADQVRVREDLDVFATFFEAFMGFYRKFRQV